MVWVLCSDWSWDNFGFWKKNQPPPHVSAVVKTDVSCQLGTDYIYYCFCSWRPKATFRIIKQNFVSKLTPSLCRSSWWTWGWWWQKGWSRWPSWWWWWWWRRNGSSCWGLGLPIVSGVFYMNCIFKTRVVHALIL